jgi:hypothetical protein
LHEIAAKVATWSLGGGQTLEPRDIVQQIRSGTGIILHEIAAKVAASGAWVEVRP